MHLKTVGLGPVLLLAALAVAGCQSSEVVKVDGGDGTGVALAQVGVGEVVVTMDTPRPNPSLQARLKSELERTLPRCANGPVVHRMVVNVVEFEEMNTAQAVMIGDEIEIAARVSLIEPESGAKQGEYYVQNSFFWGGLIGAAMMSDAEGTLSEDFANEVCKELFGKEVG